MEKIGKSIAIVYFDAASGHRSAAVALQKAINLNDPSAQIRMVNITEVFDHHRTFGKIVRMGINYFNWQIKRDKVFDLQGLINLSLLCHDLVSKKGIDKIANFWRNSPPDAVISVTPMYNPVLFKCAKLANPVVKCLTVPVDFEEVRSRYWFTPKVDQYYLNATDQLQKQAQAATIPGDRLFEMAGMPADPEAYDVKIPDKENELRKLGLNAKLPTGFLSFGGQGTSNVLDILKALNTLPPVFNMIVMCGKNEPLYTSVKTLETPYAKAVFSYLPQTPISYLHLADFAIGKPGAMTITEALITGTPLIALKSKGMSPVQKGNEDWMTQNQVGVVAKTPADVASAVMDVISNPQYKTALDKHFHRAVFEMAGTIVKITNSSN